MIHIHSWYLIGPCHMSYKDHLNQHHNDDHYHIHKRKFQQLNDLITTVLQNYMVNQKKENAYKFHTVHIKPPIVNITPHKYALRCRKACGLQQTLACFSLTCISCCLRISSSCWGLMPFQRSGMTR